MSNTSKAELDFDDLLVSPGEEVDSCINFCDRVLANNPHEMLSGWSTRMTHEGIDVRSLPCHVWMHSHDYDEVSFSHDFEDHDTFEWYRDLLVRNRREISILLLMFREGMVPKYVSLDRLDYVTALREPPVRIGLPLSSVNDPDSRYGDAVDVAVGEARAAHKLVLKISKDSWNLVNSLSTAPCEIRIDLTWCCEAAGVAPALAGAGKQILDELMLWAANADTLPIPQLKAYNLRHLCAEEGARKAVAAIFGDFGHPFMPSSTG